MAGLGGKKSRKTKGAKRLGSASSRSLLMDRRAAAILLSKTPLELAALDDRQSPKEVVNADTQTTLI
jgi:hypothetical protein